MYPILPYITEYDGASYNVTLSVSEKTNVFMGDWDKTNLEQLLVGHNFRTIHRNFEKLCTTAFEHVFIHIVNFHSQWIANI